MAELTEEDRAVYEQLNAVVQRQQSGQEISEEENSEVIRQLRNLADRTNDFDPDNLDNIIAFAQNFPGNSYVETILSRATEQKQRLNAQDEPQAEQELADEQQPSENTTTEEHEPETIILEEHEPENRETDYQEGTPRPIPVVNFVASNENDFARPSLQELQNQAYLINEPSYNLLQQHKQLKDLEERTPEQQAYLEEVERQIEVILANIDHETIDDENAVALKDYLEISNNSESLTEEQRLRNEGLERAVDEKLADYDMAHNLEGIEELTPQQLTENANAWSEIARKAAPHQPNFQLEGILRECPQEVRNSLNDIIENATIHSLKLRTPEGSEEEKTVQFFNALSEKEAEHAALINAEYLKQQALDEYCTQNNISPEELNNILTMSAKGIALSPENQATKEAFERHLQQHMERFPDFNGPYENKHYLAQAITTANGIIINRATTLDSRVARKLNAPGISNQIAEMNKKFSQQHPKLAAGLKFAKTMGVNMLKTAAVGAVLGPVGLTAYSAFKTAKTIRKSYKRYQEQTGGNFKGFLKHLTKRENRAELLTLAGQVAATAISGYFTGAVGLENMDFGMAGQAMGHANGHLADAASQVVQNTSHTAGGYLQAGFEKIISTPRRAVSMASSLGIGMVKFLSEKSNQSYARKNLKALILGASNTEVSKKDLRELEKFSSKEEFMEKLAALAPEMSAEAKEEAFKYAEMAKKANPKTAFVAAVSGAAIGLAAAAATEYMHDAGTEQSTDNTPQTPDNGEHDATPAPDEQHQPAQPEAPTIDPVEATWADDAAAARRFESFGIDAKNANEMLREMGVIKEGDNHFYRQSELARLVNDSDLSSEQKSAIQAWADDRDSRVANLKAWQAAHPAVHHVASHADGSGHPVPETPETPAPTTVTPDGDNQSSPVEENQASSTEEEITKQKYHVQGRIDRLRNLRGEVEATDPIKAAQAFHQNQNIQLTRRSNLTITDEDGDRTVLKTKIGRKAETTTITEYDGKDKISTQKTKFYKDGYSTTKIKADVDGDGKKDTIVTTTREDGTSISMTTLATGERRVQMTQSDGTTVTNSTRDMESRGMSHSEAKRVAKWSYSNMSKILKGKTND